MPKVCKGIQSFLDTQHSSVTLLELFVNCSPMFMDETPEGEEAADETAVETESAPEGTDEASADEAAS